MSAIHALCRAAIHIPPSSGDIAIRALAPDLAEAVRVCSALDLPQILRLMHSAAASRAPSCRIEAILRVLRSHQLGRYQQRDGYGLPLRCAAYAQDGLSA